MKPTLWIGFFWIFITYACDPCGDCGEPLYYDPTIRMVFINQDSASVLGDSIDLNKDSIKIYSNLRVELIDSAEGYSDSLVVLDSLVAAGETEYVDDQAMLTALIEDMEAQTEWLKVASETLTKINTALGKIVTTINNGSVQLQQVTLLESGMDLEYEDSMSSFRLPLLLATELATNTTSYELTIGGEVYTIGFEYAPFETVDASRIVSVKARDFGVVSHTFDSLEVTCRTSECISDEATLTVYF